MVPKSKNLMESPESEDLIENLESEGLVKIVAKSATLMVQSSDILFKERRPYHQKQHMLTKNLVLLLVAMLEVINTILEKCMLEAFKFEISSK